MTWSAACHKNDQTSMIGEIWGSHSSVADSVLGCDTDLGNCLLAVWRVRAHNQYCLSLMVNMLRPFCLLSAALHSRRLASVSMMTVIPVGPAHPGRCEHSRPGGTDCGKPSHSSMLIKKEKWLLIICCDNRSLICTDRILWLVSRCFGDCVEKWYFSAINELHLTL